MKEIASTLDGLTEVVLAVVGTAASSDYAPIMSTLYAYSLMPVVAVSLLLFFTVLLRQRGSWGLAAYCGAIAAWSSNLVLAFSPSAGASEFGLKMSAVGAFIVAAFLHAAYDLTEQRRYELLWIAYGAAAVITVAGFAIPGLLYDPTSLAAGPLFWPAMALAVSATAVPFWHLARAYPDAPSQRQARMRVLFAAGFVGYLGAWSNATLLAYDVVLPYGLFLVLASLLMLTRLVQSMQRRADQRLFERSLMYSALAAFLSAGFLFGALVFLADTTAPVLRDYGLGAFFLLCMAALAIEPVRQHVQEVVGRHLAGDRAQAMDLAEALADQEARADQAQRLAELGAFTSAIAHEVRNPLGVISAYLSILERQDVDGETIDEMREQIDRASGFLDDLLHYGRPSPLELRMVKISDTIELAMSSATAGLGEEAPDDVEWCCEVEPSELTIESDQGQLMQVFVILLENALLAVDQAEERKLRVEARGGDDNVVIVFEDSGPGIEKAVVDRLFEPFVTTRKREGRSHGTGLGLAIASGIIERHGGAISATESALGGARFEIELPRHQKVLAAATDQRYRDSTDVHTTEPSA